MYTKTPEISTPAGEKKVEIKKLSSILRLNSLQLNTDGTYAAVAEPGVPVALGVPAALVVPVGLVVPAVTVLHVALAELAVLVEAHSPVVSVCNSRHNQLCPSSTVPNYPRKSFRTRPFEPGQKLSIQAPKSYQSARERYPGVLA